MKEDGASTEKHKPLKKKKASKEWQHTCGSALQHHSVSLLEGQGGGSLGPGEEREARLGNSEMESQVEILFIYFSRSCFIFIFLFIFAPEYPNTEDNCKYVLMQKKS